MPWKLNKFCEYIRAIRVMPSDIHWGKHFFFPSELQHFWLGNRNATQPGGRKPRGDQPTHVQLENGCQIRNGGGSCMDVKYGS